MSTSDVLALAITAINMIGSVLLALIRARYGYDGPNGKYPGPQPKRPRKRKPKSPPKE